MIIISVAIVLLVVWGVVATILVLGNDGLGRPELAERNRRPETRQG
ncbi:hypothetical protein [Cryobacterium algoritolerans]|nr:hypothetical protein [Cryobacterium algoritolerans]